MIERGSIVAKILRKRLLVVEIPKRYDFGVYRVGVEEDARSPSTILNLPLRAS
jgi:hypothetical protein